MRTAHAAWCLALAEEATAASPGPLDEACLDRLERDHDNVRAALDWLAQRTMVRAVQLARALWCFWNGRAYLREGAKRLARALAVGGGSVPIRARALEGAGYLHSMTGETATGVRRLQEAVALREAASDRTGLLESLNWLGNVLLWTDPG